MSNELIPTFEEPTLSLGNAPPYSVSELAGALKRTLESSYDHVRLRGEVSKVTRHSSGHVYLTLKDDKAAIDGVIWKGNVSRLKAQAEQGLEVIVTGKITTFPASSKYQIVIETLEAAGIGALLAQLERLKTKLSHEGLFEPSRKRPLPFAPKTIGVITSPTGAVIRDILHRLRERWPCRVIVWPVVVQGDASAPQVIAALNGFHSGLVPRPDVIIIARGGGSVEDLWPFNDEALARSVAASTIPIISAIGHETDTTLIDFVSDRRAPTPTGAAEIATPVLLELKGLLADLERRRQGIFARNLTQYRDQLVALSRALPKPQDLLFAAQQRCDFISHRLSSGGQKRLNAYITSYERIGMRLSPALIERPHQIKKLKVQEISHRLDMALPRLVLQKQSNARLPELGTRLSGAFHRSITLKRDRLLGQDQLRLSLNPDRPLSLGFARVAIKGGGLLRSVDKVKVGDVLELTLTDGKIDAIVTKDSLTPKPLAPKPKPLPPPPDQGSLF
jgi:exodeoxyribonuclease VII large subunit